MTNADDRADFGELSLHERHEQLWKDLNAAQQKIAILQGALAVTVDAAHMCTELRRLSLALCDTATVYTPHTVNTVVVSRAALLALKHAASATTHFLDSTSDDAPHWRMSNGS